MATTIKALPNQSMSDVVIQATGSMEACMQFCKDNDIVASDIPIVGTVYVVSDTALNLGDQSVLKYLSRNTTILGTLSGIGMGYITEDGAEAYISESGIAYIAE